MTKVKCSGERKLSDYSRSLTGVKGMEGYKVGQKCQERQHHPKKGWVGQWEDLALLSITGVLGFIAMGLCW